MSEEEFEYDPVAFRHRHVNSCLEQYERDYARYTKFVAQDIDYIIGFIADNQNNRNILMDLNDPIHDECLEHFLKMCKQLEHAHHRLKVAKFALGKYTKQKEILQKNPKAEIEF